jgi:hypothetical protein
VKHIINLGQASMVTGRVFQIKIKVLLCIIFFISFLSALYIFFTWKNYIANMPDNLQIEGR